MDKDPELSLDEGSSESELEDSKAQTPLRSSLKKPIPAPVAYERPELPPQPDPKDLDISKLTPLSPEIIARQATINIGTIGHVAHGKSTVVKAISGVQTVRFKNELERNITIKLGYANAKIYKCDNPDCPRPTCYRSYKSEKEVDPPCERDGCSGKYRLLRHVSFVDCPGHDILMSTMLSGAAVMVCIRPLGVLDVSDALTFMPIGRGSTTDCWKRNMSTTPNQRTFSSHRNYEAKSHHHSAEQGGPYEGRQR